MMITEADLIVIQRANAAGGRDAALTELRRRFPGHRGLSSTQTPYNDQADADRRRSATRHNKPVPSRAKPAGSGTGVEPSLTKLALTLSSPM